MNSIWCSLGPLRHFHNSNVINKDFFDGLLFLEDVISFKKLFEGNLIFEECILRQH